MSFRPFPFPSTLPSWFAGHMHKALQQMQIKSRGVDLFIEVRDARLPLSSINPTFSTFGKQGIDNEKRLIVYCRRDLGDAKFEVPLKRAFEQIDQNIVVFANSRSDADARAVMRHIIELSKQHRANRNAPPEEPTRVMIMGMPNVGKSSLLNALRRVGVHKGKAAFTGSNPGITKSMTTLVKIWENPPIYIYDTPGVMVTYLGTGNYASERALKMALTGGIKDSLFSLETLGEYLLWRINYRFFHAETGRPLEALPDGIRKLTPPLPTFDFPQFIHHLARRIGALHPGGIPDEERTMRWFIEAFRDGKLGSWSLDDLTFTGPFYARLPSGQALTQSLPEPSDHTGEHVKKALQLVESHTQSLVNYNPTLTLDALNVPDTMPLVHRVNLAVSTYTSLERHKFLYPRPETMSKHQLKKFEKVQLAERRQQRFQRLGVVGGSRYKVNRPWHMRTKSGKSVLAYKRSQKLRKLQPKAKSKNRKKRTKRPFW